MRRTRHDKRWTTNHVYVYSLLRRNARHFQYNAVAIQSQRRHNARRVQVRVRVFAADVRIYNESRYRLTNAINMINILLGVVFTACAQAERTFYLVPSRTLSINGSAGLVTYTYAITNSVPNIRPLVNRKWDLESRSHIINKCKADNNIQVKPIKLRPLLQTSLLAIRKSSWWSTKPHNLIEVSSTAFSPESTSNAMPGLRAPFAETTGIKFVRYSLGSLVIFTTDVYPCSSDYDA